MFIVGFVLVRVKQLYPLFAATLITKSVAFFGSERRRTMTKKVSGKTHTQEHLNTWANQNNPNNKAYRAELNNHSSQLNPNRTHQQKHHAQRRYQKLGHVEWTPDYPEWDD